VLPSPGLLQRRAPAHQDDRPGAGQVPRTLGPHGRTHRRAGDAPLTCPDVGDDDDDDDDDDDVGDDDDDDDDDDDVGGDDHDDAPQST